MKNALISSMFFLLAMRSLSQEVLIEPSRELTTINFIQFNGGVVIFKALLDGYKDSLSFILDTGSGGISLDSTTVQKLGIKHPPPEKIIRGIGGAQKVGFLKNRKLKINQLEIDSLDFHILDYEVLSALFGEKIDGIVGYSVLSRFIVKIDYVNRKLTFCSNGSIKYPRGGFTMRPQINRLAFSTAQIQDAVKKEFNYLYDIGAGLTVLFSDDYVRDNAFLKVKRKKYLKQGEGLGGKVDFYLSVMKELKLGPYKFKNVPINIFDDSYNVTSYPLLGGLIGNEIFRRFNTIINYNENQIYLKPNKFFGDLFDYAYSGVELYYLKGATVIGDIPKGSPADLAGLQPGDEVIAVDKKIGLTLNDLKQALQSTYGPVEMVIKRNGELMTKKMKVINILNGKAIPNQSVSNEFRDGIRIITNQNAVPFNRNFNQQ